MLDRYVGEDLPKGSFDRTGSIAHGEGDPVAPDVDASVEVRVARGLAQLLTSDPRAIANLFQRLLNRAAGR